MQSSDTTIPETVFTPYTLDVGKTLREAREALGLSVHDVANRIKFAPKQVEALEANDFAHLPEPAFVRGFVRSYARMLQLGEADLIAALPFEISKQQVTAPKAPAIEITFPNLKGMQPATMMWLAGAAGLALILVLFLIVPHDERNGQQQSLVEPLVLPASGVVSPEESAASSAAMTQVQESQAPAAVSAAAATPSVPAKPVEVSKPVTTVKPVVPAKPAESAKAPEVKALDKTKVEPVKKTEPTKKIEPTKPQEPVKPVEIRKPIEPVKPVEPKKKVETLPEKPKEVPAKPVAVKPVPTVQAEPKLTPAELESLKRRPLHFVVSDAALIEVVDAHGATLISRNVAAGGEKWIGGPGHAPYDISISRPDKVKLYYRGTEINLTVYGSKAVSHLKVQ